MGLVVSFAASAVAGESDEVTFDEALALAPRAPAARGDEAAHAARSKGDEGIGGTAQVTQVTAMPGAVLAPDEERGFDIQVSFSQGWNLADLGEARRGAARHERAALAAQARAGALRARLRAARRWLELRTLEVLDRELAAQIELAVQWVDSTARRVELGFATEADLADARAALATVEQRRFVIEGDRFEAANLLAVAMGREPRPLPRTGGPVPRPRLPAIDAVQTQVASARELPQVIALRLAETAARARAIEAAAAYAPVLQVGGQFERPPPDAWVAYGMVGLQLTAFGQADRAKSIAEADAARAAVQAEAAQLRAQADLAEALHEVEHTREQVALIENKLLPAVTARRELRERALAVGEGTLFVLLEARQNELQVRELAARARGERLWAEVQLWLLLAELTPPSEESP